MGKDNTQKYAWKFILIFSVSFHNVSCNTVEGENGKTKDTLVDRIKFCPTVDVIGNSSYIKSCNAFKYPREFASDDDNLALCIIVYDTTTKICEYSSKQSTSNLETNLLPSSVQQLDTEIEKFVLFNNNSDICKNISSIFNKLNHSKVEGFKDIIPFIEYSQTTLLTKENCRYTCRNATSKKINHLCTYLLWVNEFFNTLKPLKAENEKEGRLPEKETQDNTKTVIVEEKNKNNEKKDSQVIDKNEIQKKIVDNPNTASESENQQNKQKLPSSTNKKPDDVPKQSINTIKPSNNELKNKPNDQNQLDESNNRGSLPAPPKEEDAADVVESKKNDGDVDTAHQLPPDETNQDADSISVEDHPIKKENDNLEEAIDQENADNDQKEANNQGVDGPVKNPDDNDEFRRQKFIPQGDEESHFFTYFSVISLLCIVLYFGYHNKQKIFAILLEGRRSRRGRGSRRRPSTASYRKLDCNLEEAVTSQCNSNVTHVIY